MSIVELVVIVFLSLGLLDKDKVSKIFNLFNSSRADQVRKVIGDDTIAQNWVWLEEE